MHVRRLSVENFRNFDRRTFEFAEAGAAICGDNGRGKSNLLEAVHYLAVAKSGRGAIDRDVARWGAAFFAVEAEVVREDGPVRIRIAYDRRAQKKKAFLQREPLPKLSRLIGTFNAVLFSPEDVDLVLRDPAERRRLLDILVSQSNASYLSDLEHYRRALSQRNRLLKEAGRRLLQSPGSLAPWDHQLAERGGRIVAARLAALDRVTPKLCEFYGRIASAPERLATRYRGVGVSTDPGKAREGLAEALASRRREEVEAGHTLSGPHRDRFAFTLSDRFAHQFGSKGQLKSVLLAWKLAEAAYLEAETGRRPVLLMDDVFSELDRSRALSALDLLSGFGQLLMTSARDPDLCLRERGYDVLDL